MSKRYKGKACAYCAAEGVSETADHVFAREFFLPTLRDGIPKVPACRICNRSKSELEHYLATLLPFGGNHPDSHPLLHDRVPQRLASNHRLWRDIASGVSRVSLGAEPDARMGIPFAPEKLIELIQLVVRGLTLHHWDLVIPPDHTVLASLVNPAYEPILREIFMMDGAAYARGMPGNGSFRYEGKQATDHPGLTIWRFQIYGGIQFLGDERAPGVVASDLWACSTPSSVTNLLVEP